MLRIEAAAKRGSSKPKTERDPESTTVFVGGLSYYTNESKLEEVFQHCGEILDIRMPLSEDGSRVIPPLKIILTNFSRTEDFAILSLANQLY